MVTKTRPQYRLVDLLLIIALCALVLGLIDWFVHLTPTSSIFGPVFAFEFAFFAWIAVWRRVRGMRHASVCQECGRRFLPAKRAGLGTICPQCRQRAFNPVQSRKERQKALRVLAFMCALMIVGMGLITPGLVKTHLADVYDTALYWVVVPLLAIALTVLVLAVLVGVVLVFILLRQLLARSERYTLNFARKCADAPGVVEQIGPGPTTIWSSAASDSTALLKEEMEFARRRFEEFVGEPCGVDRPLRILCFDRRSAFVAFHRSTIANLWNLDGLYNPSPVPTITFNTEIVPYRLSEPRLTARSLFIFHFLKTYKGFFPPFWLLHGIGNSLAGYGLDDRRQILNRKMIIALARQNALDSEVFGIKKRAIAKLLRNWYDHRSFAKFTEIIVRSWSLGEFLGGQVAPPRRREPFRAFLKELGPKDRQEDVFERHFGFGFEALIERWREWIVEHGLGDYRPPPPEVRRALIDGIIRTIEDQNARPMDRILAIRDVGRMGYVLGADVLIDLVKAGGEILSQEAIRSLEQISGHPWGREIDRWEAWWKSLPDPAVSFEDSIHAARETAAS